MPCGATAELYAIFAPIEFMLGQSDCTFVEIHGGGLATRYR